MRRHEKKQCLELVSTIEEGHKQIAEFIKQQNIEAAQSLLADCQQAAIEIGTAIDEAEGEGTKAVKLLEEYCEFLFSVHTEVGQNTSFNLRKTEKRTRQFLSKIRNEIRSGLSSQTEMLFLPYKASMWDSLESIWMAADRLRG